MPWCPRSSLSDLPLYCLSTFWLSTCISIRRRIYLSPTLTLRRSSGGLQIALYRCCLHHIIIEKPILDRARLALLNATDLSAELS